MGATETIAKWIVNTTYEDIPPDALRVANESCFDVLGVILAGVGLGIGENLAGFILGAEYQAACVFSLLVIILLWRSFLLKRRRQVLR